MDSNYTDFKDFHTRVLKPAQKEINKYSDINFEYELIKDGRKTTAIKLIIETKDIIQKIHTAADDEELLNSRNTKKKKPGDIG